MEAGWGGLGWGGGGKKADQCPQSKQGEGPGWELGSAFRPWSATAVDCLWGWGSSREYEIGKRWLRLSSLFDCPWTSASSPVKNVWQLLAQNKTVRSGQPLPYSSNTLSQLVSVICLACHAALLMPWANQLSTGHGKHKGREPLVYFPRVLIGFNCWPIGFQVQKRVSRTKTSVNLGPWERLATLLVSNIKDFIQLHMPLGCRGPCEACPHRSDVLFFFFFNCSSPIGQIADTGSSY